MGQLVSATLPNLISGVSQQPWNVRLPTQAEEQVNCYSSVTEFLKRRPATRHIARIGQAGAADVTAHTIMRDDNERYIVLASSSGIAVYDLQGKAYPVRMMPDAASYLAGITSPDRDLRFLTISDYTFICNKRKTVRALPTPSPSRPVEAIVFIRQASYNTTYTLTVDGTPYTFTTKDGLAPVGEPVDSLSSREVADALANALPKDVFAVRSSHSTIWLQRYDAGPFSIKVEDTRSNTHISCCKGSVQRFSDLPLVAPRGFVTEITGDATSSFDNYYCVFEPNEATEDFGTGTWKESVKPGIPYQLDAATMPHALIRQADGSFTFGPLTWGERVCGDAKSAPFPSFVDRQINGLFFYRNRLAFLAGENVIMSEAGEFFNFFLSTVTTLVDSDVIDVAASHVRNNILEHACVFAGGLLLFSGQSQFVLEHDTVLSNATVSLKPVTEFEASMLASPVSAGKTVFFATDKGTHSGVREYYTMPDASDQNDAADVTAHVPRYIKGNIRKLVCSTNEDILLVLSEQERHSVWMYKYFWSGNEKIQSSWSRWDMAGEVLALVFADTQAFLVLRYPEDGLYLEALSFEPGHKDEEANFEYCLDRKITEKDVQLSPYDKVNKSTIITLPYKAPENLRLVTRKGAGLLAGYVSTIYKKSGNSIAVKGNLHGQRFFIGVPYTSTYVFSTFAIREDRGKGNAVTTGRLQLRTLTLNCAETGYLEMYTAPLFGEGSVKVFTGRELGHGTNVLGHLPLYTGALRFPLRGHNVNINVTVRSASFLPFALVNAAWEGFYNSRHQRI